MTRPTHGSRTEGAVLTAILESRVALITGGSSGIGRAVAEQLIDRGVRTVITGRDRDRGLDVQRVLSERGGEARFIRMDASSEASVSEAIESAVTEFGAIDFLLNSAGYEGPLGPITDLSEEDCDQLLAVNVKGPLMAAKHVVPHLLRRGGGCIVNVASFLATVPFPLGPGYGATKAALLHLTRSLAAGYGSQGIRCHAVCPFNTDTAMIERVSGGSKAVREQLASMNPSGRLASAHDVARVITDLFTGDRTIEDGAAVLVDAGGTVTHAA